MNSKLSIGLWNLEWAAMGSSAGRFFLERFRDLFCDVFCITEGYTDVLPSGGYSITSEADYGYPMVTGRRKVLLWSRSPWRDVDTIGSPQLPGGRFVAGTTDTPLGALRFIGVCVPWRDAHVRTGKRDKSVWEDHLTYLQNLAGLLRSETSERVVLLGDFNQRIPRAHQPEAVFAALCQALSPGFRVISSGVFDGAPGPSIDHVALRGDLLALPCEYLNPQDSDGRAMSDHFGLRVQLTSYGCSSSVTDTHALDCHP